MVQILSLPVCAECNATVEALTRLADEYPVLKVERLNIADSPELADRYSLLSFEYDLLAIDAVAINDRLAGLGCQDGGTNHEQCDDDGHIGNPVKPKAPACPQLSKSKPA